MKKCVNPIIENGSLFKVLGYATIVGDLLSVSLRFPRLIDAVPSVHLTSWETWRNTPANIPTRNFYAPPPIT